jgi:hypothetical protein
MYYILHFLGLNNFQFPLANLHNTMTFSSSAKYPFGSVPSICSRRVFPPYVLNYVFEPECYADKVCVSVFL